MLKGRDATEELPPPPPTARASVGSAPLPPLPQQQEKLGRISGSKLDPGLEDEETLVTSLPTPRGPKITFLSEKTGKTPPGRTRRCGGCACVCGGLWGQVLYTCTHKHGQAAPSRASSCKRRIHPVVRCTKKEFFLFYFFCLFFFHSDTMQGHQSNKLVVLSF